MKRGDIVVLAPPSPFNKPRPAVVIQKDVFSQNENVTVALITSDPAYTNSLRTFIAPTATNGLRKPSEIMADNLQTVPVTRIGGLIGEVDQSTMRRLEDALRIFLDLP